MPELSLLEKLFVFFQHIVPQHLLSRITGALAETRYKPIKDFLIRQFIHQFDVDLTDAELVNKLSDQEIYSPVRCRSNRRRADRCRGLSKL